MSASYNYTADGVRTSKTVDGVTHTYYYVDGKLLREVFGTTVLDFFYDGNGTPIAMRQGSTTSSNYTNYYYITNLQGDVIRLVDIYGNTAALYSYDPYGNTISATGSHANINPLRYRGYYYDTETGLYYLQSRYYDPAIGRFISCDEFASTGQGILGYNMFAYCNNNPIMYKDSTGYVVSLAVIAGSAAGGAVAGAMISAVSYTVNQGLNGEAINTADLLEATLIGAASGAAGGVIGCIKNTKILIKAIASAAVGAYVGYSSYDGEISSDWVVSVLTATASTFLGSLIDAGGSGFFDSVFTNFATASLPGTITEMTGTGIKQGSNNFFEKATTNTNHTEAYYRQQMTLKEELFHGH